MSEINEEYYLKEKYDLEEILNPLYNTKQKYYEWCTKRNIEDYSLIFVIDQIKASCLGPAYNYNRLVDEIIQDLFWEQIKYTISEEQWVSMGRRTEQIIIAVQNCLISIKIDILSSYPNEYWKYPVVIYYICYRNETNFETKVLFLKWIQAGF